ncbi:hypothetical protein B0H14DRAFT_3488876 [Mycena olivaceomarginata]|nr:hypothetical protein B0H14DRAFT_3488876 [Mycena olivaceomarginata]
MVDISLESAFHSLEINLEPFFHPRKGFESRRGSETENFYVVMEGRIPGIYTHWEDASPQVNAYRGAVHKKHLGWSAAISAWDGSRRPSSTPASSMPSPSKRDAKLKIRQRGIPFTTQKKPEERAPASVPALPTPTASKKKVLYPMIDTKPQQAARRGMADGSLRKVDVTTGVQNAFDRATESALEAHKTRLEREAVHRPVGLPNSRLWALATGVDTDEGSSRKEGGRTRAFIVAEAASPADRILFAMRTSQWVTRACGARCWRRWQEASRFLVTHQHRAWAVIESALSTSPQITSRGLHPQTLSTILSGTVLATHRAHASLAPGSLALGGGSGKWDHKTEPAGVSRESRGGAPEV